MYQKEIIYLTRSKEGEKLGNAGYVRVENRDGNYHLFMQLQNLPEALTGVFAIMLHQQHGWEEIDTITIKGGKGVWQNQNRQIENGVWIQISMGNGDILSGKSKYVREPRLLDGTKPDIQTEAVTKERVADKPKAVMVSEEMLPQKALSEAEVMVTAEKQQNVVKEDKWEQILETYDTIHPYGDERIYVKIEPKDFIILQGKYQHLVNNSFLLHGFYNYRYLILGKEGDFYLGVPGVYYEREKMVAVMFGFEAFECESGHANPGDFGYYLRKVEL